MKSRYLLVVLFFIVGNLTVIIHSFGQPHQSQSSFGYSIAKQRLQLKLITSYVYFSMQGQLDMDSAAIMVSEGENLPYSLYYDEDYVNGPDNNIKELLKKGSYYLFKSGSYKRDLDSALPLLLSSKLEAEKAKNIYFQNAALAALGRYYFQNNDAVKSKSCFDEAVELAAPSKNFLHLNQSCIAIHGFCLCEIYCLYQRMFFCSPGNIFLSGQDDQYPYSSLQDRGMRKIAYHFPLDRFVLNPLKAA